VSYVSRTEVVCEQPDDPIRCGGSHDSALLSRSPACPTVGRRYELVDPKAEESRRTVKLPPTVVTKLREHRTRQVEERPQAERWAK
jgi:hypothetical protein